MYSLCCLLSYLADGSICHHGWITRGAAQSFTCLHTPQINQCTAHHPSNQTLAPSGIKHVFTVCFLLCTRYTAEDRRSVKRKTPSPSPITSQDFEVKEREHLISADDRITSPPLLFFVGGCKERVPVWAILEGAVGLWYLVLGRVLRVMAVRCFSAQGEPWGTQLVRLDLGWAGLPAVRSRSRDEEGGGSVCPEDTVSRKLGSPAPQHQLFPLSVQIAHSCYFIRDCKPTSALMPSWHSVS